MGRVRGTGPNLDSGWMSRRTRSAPGLLRLGEHWKILLPGVWELLRLNRIVILILVWKGWLGPCRWETSRDQTSCWIFTPRTEVPLVWLSSSSFSKPPGTVQAMWSSFSGRRWSKLQSSLFGGLKPSLFLHEQVLLFWPLLFAEAWCPCGQTERHFIRDPAACFQCSSFLSVC